MQMQVLVWLVEQMYNCVMRQATDTDSYCPSVSCIWQIYAVDYSQEF